MSDGGFVLKFDGKNVKPCYAVSFDYDAWQYTINDNNNPLPLPKDVKTITVTVERS